MRALPWTLALVVTVAVAGVARARGYQRHLSHRPRLALDGREAAHLDRVRDRILAREAPWATAYAALRDLAEGGTVVPHGAHGWKGQPDRWNVLYSQEVRNGLVARARAAVAYLGSRGVDPAWRPLPRRPGEATPDGWLADQAADAARIVAGMYDDFPGWRGFDVLNRGIVSAESLLVHAQAHDLLAALPPAMRPPLEAGRARLADFAEDHSVYVRLLDFADNNHPIRVHAGLGGAAIALNDLDRYRWWKPGTWFADPGNWIERAEKKLDPERRGSNLRGQLDSGAFAEGPAYMAYSEDLYSPFFLAYTRFGGRLAPLQSGRLDRLYRWSIDTRLPDGGRPPLDNAPIVPFRGPAYLVNRLPRGSRDGAQRALFGWDWTDQGHVEAGGARALELLAAWDPSDADLRAIAAEVGPARSAFDRAAGTAALRSGSGRDAAYALLLAEHDDARRKGAGHEDADPLAFFLWAEGDVLAVDPGYAGFTNVTRTNRAEHHNLVLVDGEGPKAARRPKLWTWVARGADAYLETGSPRTFHDLRLQSAHGRTSYRDVDVARTVTLVAGRALVVCDRLESERRRWPRSGRPEHELTGLFHAGGGGTKRGPAAITSLGLSFSSHRSLVPVEVAVGSTRGAPRLALGQGFDAMGRGTGGAGADQHAVLRASVRAARVDLLTVACWGRPGHAPRAPEKLLERPGAVALAAGHDTTAVVAAAQEAPGPLTIPAGGATPVVESDGTLIVVALEQSAVVAAVAHDATYLRIGQGPNRVELTRVGRGTLRR